MIRRRREGKIPLQANYYPLPTAAYIQDKRLRLTLLAAQPLGGSSLESGHLEVGTSPSPPPPTPNPSLVPR
jgi:alpha-mannosidase II